MALVDRVGLNVDHSAEPGAPAPSGAEGDDGALLLSRLGLAVLMVVVAALGASIALWTALGELRITEIQRRLTLGQMYEIGVRSATMYEYGLKNQLSKMGADRRQAAKGLSESAARLRAAGIGDAERLEIGTQLENAQSRLIRSIETPLRSLEGRGNMWQLLDRSVEDQLLQYGLARYRPGSDEEPEHAGTHHAPAAPGSYRALVEEAQLPAWQALTAKVEHIHHTVPKLALVVAGFVAALLCFTLSDLNDHRPRRANIYLLAGVAIVGGIAVAALVWDSSSWKPMAVVLACSGALFALGWRMGFFDHATERKATHGGELEPKSFFGGHMLLHHKEKLLHATGHEREKLLVLLISWTVLLSAVVGYRYSGAAAHAGEASHRAFTSEVAYNNRNAERHVLAMAGGLLPAFDLFRVRMNCSFASQRVLMLPAAAPTQTIRLAEEERNRQCEQLKAQSNRETAGFMDSQPVVFDSSVNPGRTIIRKLYESDSKGREGTPSQFFALSDGYISLATWWERSASIHLLGLTLFAIALYLIGQSLGMGHGVPSSTLAVTGSIMAVLAFALSTWQATRSYARPDEIPAYCGFDEQAAGEIRRSPERAIEVAAKLYAQARQHHAIATNSDDYRKASEFYDCATAVRPNFAIAHRERAQAHASVNRFDSDNSYSSVLARDRLGPTVLAQQRALLAIDAAGWWPPPALMDSHGFNLTLEALHTGDTGKLDAAIAVLSRAIADVSPAPGHAGSGGGSHDPAPGLPATTLRLLRTMHLNLALAQLARGDVKAAQAAYKKAFDELRVAEDAGLLAASVTDLAMLDAQCANLRRSMWSGTGVCTPVKEAIEGLKEALITGKLPPPPASKARITGVKAELGPSRASWSATLDGVDPATDTVTAMWTFYVPEWNVWRIVEPLLRQVDKAQIANGKVAAEIIYTNASGNCLQPGRYRLELYVNGRRAAAGENTEVELGSYKDYRSREMNIAFCQPADWTQSGFRENDDGRHLIRAFVNAQGKSAMYVFSLFAAKPDDAEKRIAEHRERAWQMLKKYSVGAPSDEAFARAVERFQGCDKPIAPSTVLHKSWVMPDGMAHVAFVIGDFAGDQACRVLESIGNHYDRGSAGELARK